MFIFAHHFLGLFVHVSSDIFVCSCKFILYDTVMLESANPCVTFARVKRNHGNLSTCSERTFTYTANWKKKMGKEKSGKLFFPGFDFPSKNFLRLKRLSVLSLPLPAHTLCFVLTVFEMLRNDLLQFKYWSILKAGKPQSFAFQRRSAFYLRRKI